MKIELGKTYVDTAGATGRVASVTGVKGAEVIVADDEYGNIRAYDLDGKLYNGVKIDTPIWVRDSPADDWVSRHFAGLSGGKFLAWTNGATSHSIGNMPHPTTEWAQATLQRPESTLADEQS